MRVVRLVICHSQLATFHMHGTSGIEYRDHGAVSTPMLWLPAHAGSQSPCGVKHTAMKAPFSVGPVRIESLPYLLNAFQHLLVLLLIRNNGLQQEFLDAQAFVS